MPATQLDRPAAPVDDVTRRGLIAAGVAAFGSDPSVERLARRVP